MVIITDPNCYRTMDLDMVLRSIWMPPWPWVATQATQIGIIPAEGWPSSPNMAPGEGPDLIHMTPDGNRLRGHQHGPWLR